ncbi:UDP-N-acetylmuramoyl-tripeptide--D-alanyl-D-alanine ligase [Brooklawnia cerclae]|uniref:UDP-N-acetylmuramoyl-tripeptide--D-alanyl-D-alanine ligase n=1 Tax=Brooklawnia cerclae TaxID=349934 RepID=A0ABX0SLA6_9ACTN|nr:UDP-N-acetylmuramoyl-tripeptide--D-alanyl-D-alanine ligase [Brooklawnia cerclae]NIH57517.1 UDP-N-acetylmuramoyl-tripeptide--D-alanyl-D-alanine ligase [Brooklawnia cerclae]
MNTRTIAGLADLVEAGGTEVRIVGDRGVVVGPDVVHDSRATTSGALFVALPGEKVDGHDYVADAAGRGAAAALVGREVAGVSLPQLVVGDPLAGLTSLARSLVAEARANGLVAFGITGSSGKTSTKDLLAQVLDEQGPTVSPVGSFNNELGTPLTACKVDATTKYLLSEMGARAKGDVAHLCSIVRPDVGIVVNIGTAHLGQFGSREAIAEAKGEMVEALGPDGWAVLNADDPLVDAMSSRTTARIARFTTTDGSHPRADLVVRASGLVPDDLDRFGFELSATTSDGRTESARVRLQVIGEHQVANAAAAAAAAVAAGVPLTRVAQGLSGAGRRSPMRMELHELADGRAVINDAYNANPDSMAAALRALAVIGRRRRGRAGAHPGRTIAVLGDMLELGPSAPQLHRSMGSLAAELGIDRVIAIGDFAADIAAGAVAGGTRADVCSADNAISTLELLPGDVVLVKASRGLRLDAVADRLIAGEESR